MTLGTTSRTLAAAVLLLAASPVHAVVYGQDDRQDLAQVTSPALRQLADSTVGLFLAPAVHLRGEEAHLWSLPYGPIAGLCRDDRFYDQPAAAFCTGFLIAPDVVLTAGHCVPSGLLCHGIKFAFGYSVGKAGQDPTRIPAEEVYGCRELLARRRTSHGPDWALVRLDRPAQGHKPLALDSASGVQKGTSVFVIGHPAGLPTKVAGGAVIRGSQPGGRFLADLDTFFGNSGSPVFEASTGKVIGLLTDGEKDYEWRGVCRVPKRCAEDGCRGEEVTPLSSLANDLPHLDQAQLEKKISGMR